MELVTQSSEETQELGRRLGERLSGGDVLALIGELGAGKTTFVHGLLLGLGGDPADVKSPTFVLMREYRGRTPLVHVDSYRLEGADDARWLDIDWFFSPAKVTAIEWADRIADCLPADYLEIRFRHKTAKQRSIALIPHGDRMARVVDELKAGAA